MSAQHTPGPWFASCAPFDAAVTAIQDGKQFDILGARTIGGIGAEQEANVMLAAAAPDLLEVLELYALGYSDDDLKQLASTETGRGEISPDVAKREIIRRSAIRKAKGDA
jgi:hypothetical protein